ncbi:hypothetical protein Aperf_G00000114581 [Anoplocephala perfoliata]
MNEIFKNSSVEELYRKLALSSADDPYEDAVRFLGLVASSKEPGESILKLRRNVSAFAIESEDSSSIERQSSIQSKSGCQKVLILSTARSSLRPKRKATDPVKRPSLPITRPFLAADISKAKKSRQRKTSISQKSVPKKRMPPGGKRVGAKNRNRGVQKEAEDSTPQHPSVTETPNPKASYPRWERARMAAAAKIKDKNVVVAESPLKSDTAMGSPLRRLRRASSYLSFAANESSRSSSQLGARAERYQRRILEEETSLSQFSGGESNSATQPASTSASSSDLRRRSSNLMVNFASPRTPFKPALNSTISSPPVLSASKPDRTTGKHFEGDESFSKRQKVELEGGVVGRIIPGEYNEDAMFLGEDEFLQHTNTPIRTRVETRKTPRKYPAVSPSNAGDQTIPKTPVKNLPAVVSLRDAPNRRSMPENTQRTPGELGDLSQPKTPKSKRLPLSPIGNVRVAGNSGRRSPRILRKPLQSTPENQQTRSNTPSRRWTTLSPIGNVWENPEHSSSPRGCYAGPYPLSKFNGRSSRLVEGENLPRYESPSGPAGNTRSCFSNFAPPCSFGRRVTPRKSLFSNISSTEDSAYSQETPNSSSVDNSSADAPQRKLFHSPTNKVLANAQFLQKSQQIGD